MVVALVVLGLILALSTVLEYVRLSHKLRNRLNLLVYDKWVVGRKKR